MSSLQWLIVLGNVAYLASYSVRDILWLRILNCVGMLLCMSYFLMKPEPDSIVIAWHVIFNLVNGYHIVRLIFERMPVQLTEAEQTLHATALKAMSPQQVKQILSRAHWRAAATDEVIVEDNVDLQELILIEAGHVIVDVDGTQVARLGPGQFVGEFSFLTNGRTSARCIADSPVRYAVWSRGDFEKMVTRYPEANLAIYSVLGIDLVQKLMQRNRPVPEAAV